MICKNCGKELHDMAISCIRCGHLTVNNKAYKEPHNVDTENPKPQQINKPARNVVIKFGRVSGQVFNTGCWVENRRTGATLAECHQGEKVVIPVQGPMDVVCHMNGAFGTAKGIVIPGKAYRVFTSFGFVKMEEILKPQGKSSSGVSKGALAVGSMLLGVLVGEATGGELDTDVDIDDDFDTDMDVDGDFEGGYEGDYETADIDGDGEIDTLGADIDGDGEIDTVGVDTDGDGAVDTVITDTDGDGEADALIADTDGNGEADALIADTDGDGEADTFIADTDGDGEVDTLIADADSDGYIDTLVADTNGDGLIDHYSHN